MLPLPASVISIESMKEGCTWVVTYTKSPLLATGLVIRYIWGLGNCTIILSQWLHSSSVLLNSRNHEVNFAFELY